LFVRVVGFYTPSVLARSTASRAFTTILMLATLGLLGFVFRVLSNSPLMAAPKTQTKLFYGWYIVAVGFLSHVACAFHMSSTLSVFLKPLTEDLSVSRGLFSLLRSGEILIGAGMAPLIGPLVDRYGGRWLMAGGALVAGSGFVLLSQVSSFWQFFALRWILITIGGVFMCHMVVSVTISRRGSLLRLRARRHRKLQFVIFSVCGGPGDFRAAQPGRARTAQRPERKPAVDRGQ
jgi:hypothetical protein